MSIQDDYNQQLETIKAITEMRKPNMPVAVYAQEAQDLLKWCEPDLPRLYEAGLKEEHVETLAARIGALREAQSIWNATRFTSEDAQKKYNEDSPAAYERRDELLHDFRHGYRRDEKLLKRVRAIADGTGDADMLQDLNDLAVLGRENPAPLEGITFDMSKLDEAAKISDELSSLHAVARGEVTVGPETVKIRNQAYTHVKEAVDEIRKCGEYEFWRDKERLRGYRSEHRRRQRRG